MARHLVRRRDRERRRTQPRLEVLEGRWLLAAAVPGVTLDPLLVPKYVNPLPNPLDPGFIYQTTDTTSVTLEDGTTRTVPLYHVGVYQVQQDLGLGLTGPGGKPVKTTVWGYGTSAATATYPGRTFEVQSNQAVAVQWTNGLVDAAGNFLPHLLPVDKTLLDPAYPASTDPQDNLQSAGVPTVTHLHGGHTQATSDGGPREWFTPTDKNGSFTSGPDYPADPRTTHSPTFIYDNTQQAATLWYHDHSLGMTRLNVYAGLAGFYIIHDPNEEKLIARNRLPAETYDIPLAIQDRMFYGPGSTDNPATPWVEAPGQLYYPYTPPEGTTAPSPSVQPEFFGDTIMVNGKAWPVLNVEPRMYRFRVLDGSDSRFYNLSLHVNGSSSLPFFQVGSDSGLLASPVKLRQVLIGPAERADIVVDFSKLAGKTIIMTNNAKSPYPDGDPADPNTVGQIMAFRVSLPKNTSIPDTVLPAKLNTIPRLGHSNNTRQLALYENKDQYGRTLSNLGTLAGPMAFLAPITEVIRQGDTETWKIYNTTEDTHTIHLHAGGFQLISRQKFQGKINPATGGLIVTRLIGKPRGPDPNEAGVKDTFRMNPGEVTVIKAKFDLPGKYVWHCHLTSHEDYDMMRYFVVTPR